MKNDKLRRFKNELEKGVPELTKVLACKVLVYVYIFYIM